MNSPQYDEMLKAVALLREYPGAKKELDYTLYSVKIMDFLLADSYQNGKLRKPDGKFARNQGVLTLGIAGYITQVILKNTHNTKVLIDPTDEKWHLHFTVVGETGYSIQPTQLVIKRAKEGLPAALHPLILATIKSFDHPKEDAIYEKSDTGFINDAETRPWWKFW